MTADTLAILMSWAVSLSGYPAPDVMPELEFKQHEFFVENACLGNECDVQAWYNDQGIVYLDERYEERSGIQWFGYSLVVHEMTHYLQDINGNSAPDCSDYLERENEAYKVQRRFISEALYRVDPIRPKWTACAE